MLSSEFKEMASDRIILPEKDYDTFLEFLSCCYPGMDKRVTDGNVEEILPLVNKYQVDSLKQRCEEILLDSIDSTADIDDVYRSFYLAAEYDMAALKERCIEIASERNIDDMMNAKEDHDIPPEIHEQVLALALKRLQLDVQEYSSALDSAKSRNNDKQYFLQNILMDCVPNSYACGALAYSITSYGPQKGSRMNLEERKSLIKAVRVSRKLGDTTKSKILLKICSERSDSEIEEILDEDEVKCLPSDIKDFILRKTSTLPDDILWS